MINLLRASLALLAFALSPFAYGADYKYGNAEYGFHDSAEAACRAGYGMRTPQPGRTFYRSFPDSGSQQSFFCTEMIANIGENGFGYVTRQGDTCSPPKIFNAAAGSCALPPGPTCTKGQKWNVKRAGSDNPTNNAGGCEAVVIKMSVCHAEGMPPVVYCWYEMELTGNPAKPGVTDNGPSASPPPPDATPVPSPPKPPPPKPGDSGSGGGTGDPSTSGGSGACPAGTVQAGFSESGKPLCVGMGTNPTNPPPPGDVTTKPPVQSPDGQMSSQDVVVKNRDGSTTTTTTIRQTDANGNVTVSVRQNTTESSAGTPGSSDQGEKDKGFCQANPTLSICRESSVSGSCEATSCVGDAIQCATLRETAKMQCREQKDRDDADASGMLALGRDAGSGNDPQKGILPSPDKASVIDLPTSLDTSGWLGGGACFADKTIAVMGKSIVIPFSKVCNILLAFRYAIMFVAAIISFKTISGAIFN